ncbi:MAG TPA: hypothetical protein VFS05_16395 [Gemmatimonadaceae bacterium]|nr:hypothetical protein [Gemmatimonadaceae bacterium]
MTSIGEPVSIWKSVAPSSPKAAPRTVDETGIRRVLLEELALKTIFLEGELNLRELAERMGLSYPVVDELFQRLRKAQFCEVTGMAGGTHRVTLTAAGRARAQDLLSRNSYAGVAPIPIADYIAEVRSQSGGTVTAADVRRAFSPLVLGDDVLDELGVAILSGTSMVLHGPTGTGKTAIAEHIPDIFHGGVWIPHAVEVDGQIITVYDPGSHRVLPGGGPGSELSAADMDRRWLLCERPTVVAGGELTIDMLDLQYNPSTGFYAAPLQMKANNGVLVLDDFGRQRIRPEELLNRWIVPLDRRVDFLTLQGGRKFAIPFEVLVVFSTNLDPRTGFAADGRAGVSDEAFLRRIPNKIDIGYASREQFHEIFHRTCLQFGLEYDAALVDRLVDYLSELKQPLRPCYPRDIVRQICWHASYANRTATLDWPALEHACHSYFLDKEPAAPITM